VIDLRGIYRRIRAIRLCVGSGPRSATGPIDVCPSRDQQIAVISALTEGCSIRATERLTSIHRDTIMRLGIRCVRAPLLIAWRRLGAHPCQSVTI